MRLVNRNIKVPLDTLFNVYLSYGIKVYEFTAKYVIYVPDVIRKKTEENTPMLTYWLFTKNHVLAGVSDKIGGIRLAMFIASYYWFI